MAGIQFSLNKNGARPYYKQIRDQLVAYAHFGLIKEGDRLPSVRELASQLGINTKSAFQIYQKLADLGMVETLPRSGVRIKARRADVDRIYRAATAKFLKMTLQEARHYGLSPRMMAHLITKFTSREKRGQITCGVIECNREQVDIFTHELHRRLHIRTFPLLLSSLSRPETIRLPVFQDAAFLVTTDFHIGEVSALGQRIGKTVYEIRLDPRFHQMSIESAQQGRFAMIVSDTSFAPQFKKAIAQLASEAVAERILLLPYTNLAELQQTLQRVDSVYISSLCPGFITDLIPPHVQINRFDNVICQASLDQLELNLIFYFISPVTAIHWNILKFGSSRESVGSKWA